MTVDAKRSPEGYVAAPCMICPGCAKCVGPDCPGRVRHNELCPMPEWPNVAEARDVTTTEDLEWVAVQKRPVIVRAALIEGAFKVKTNEGDTLRLEGGWLLEGDDGRRWPVDRDYFARHYDVLGVWPDAV